MFYPKKKMRMVVNSPCHEDVSKMLQVGRDKYCKQCEKIVHDFSKMTDEELIRLMTHPPQHLCGIMRKEQTAKIYAVPQIPTIPGIAKWLHFLLPAAALSFIGQAKGAGFADTASIQLLDSLKQKEAFGIDSSLTPTDSLNTVMDTTNTCEEDSVQVPTVKLQIDTDQKLTLGDIVIDYPNVSGIVSICPKNDDRPYRPQNGLFNAFTQFLLNTASTSNPEAKTPIAHLPKKPQKTPPLFSHIIATITKRIKIEKQKT